MEESRLKQFYRAAYLSLGFVITLPVGLLLVLFIGTLDKNGHEYLRSHSLMLIRCLIASSIAFCTGLFFFEIIDFLSNVLFSKFGNFGVESDISKNILFLIFSTGGVGLLELIVIGGSIFWLYQNVRRSLFALSEGKSIEITKKD